MSRPGAVGVVEGVRGSLRQKRAGLKGRLLAEEGCGEPRCLPWAEPLGFPLEAGEESRAFSSPRGTMDQRAPAGAPTPMGFQQIRAR